MGGVCEAEGVFDMDVEVPQRPLYAITQMLFEEIHGPARGMAQTDSLRWVL